MSKLNRDILYLIFQEFKDDKKTLYSCLSVNKTWCETIIPILWKNPWKCLKREKKKLLLVIILSHLSDESRNNLRRGIGFLTKTYQRPLFNYIRFCRHLNFNQIIRIIDTFIPFEKHKFSIKNEIFNLFINENTKYTHLYIPEAFNYQIHLIPGAKRCFSEIEFLSCDTRKNDNVLAGLTEIIESIKELELFINPWSNPWSNQRSNNYGIVKLIETPKKLLGVHFRISYYHLGTEFDKSLWNILENLFIKHANNIEYSKITNQLAAKILSSFINLKTLELSNNSYLNTWNNLENLSFPSLQILRSRKIPIRIVASLIENTNGHLIEINIDGTCPHEFSNKRIIKAIYQNCPNIEYLKLNFINSDLLELENLLINCQHLNGLYIFTHETKFDWDKLFEILTKSSPTSLFKFKFRFVTSVVLDLESLRFFFDNWKGRHPMLLQIISFNIDSIEKEYKEKGILKKYDCNNGFEDFEWL